MGQSYQPEARSPDAWGKKIILLTRQLLDTEGVTASVRDNANGAAVTFLGITRNETGGRRVLYLEYEAYQEMAEKLLGRIADEGKAGGNVVLRVPLSKRKGEAAGNGLHRSQLALNRTLKFSGKVGVVQSHQTPRFPGILGPDNGTVMLISGLWQQGQKRQRPGRRKSLPRGETVALAGLHRAYDCLLVVVPLTRWQANPVAQTGIGTVTTDQ